jgi:hypothetical protein
VFSVLCSALTFTYVLEVIVPPTRIIKDGEFKILTATAMKFQSSGF